MRAVAILMPACIFSAAAVAQQEKLAPVAISGADVYRRWCAACHAPGPNHPGTQALEFIHGGKSPAALIDRRDLAPEYLRLVVRKGIANMPPFRPTEISDEQLEALASWISKSQ